jgi:disulfide bond formation protein DsbB
MTLLRSSRALCGAAVLLSLGAVGAALYTQLQWDMQPCPWCVLQRALFCAIALAALPGLLLPVKALRWTSGVAIFALAACGLAAALWQHFVAASSTSCAMTLADRVVRGAGLDEWWPLGFSATASCADAAVKLAGLSYEFYSAALFALLMTAAVLLLRARR